MMRDIDESKAPLLDHLIELRKRLLYCIYAMVITGGLCFYFADHILAFLVAPLKSGYGGAGGKLVYTKLYEAFFVQVKIAVFGGFFVSFPIIANQLWAFVAPGLYAKEKKALLPFLLATPLLFLMGASLAYYGVMPAAFHFFLKFQGQLGGVQLEALPSVDAYLSLVMQFILAFGVSFLLPVLVMLLNRAGILSRAQLVAARRYVIVGAAIVAAAITPPDALSMIMLAIPLVLLYEFTLIAIWLTDRRKAAEEKAEAAETAIIKAAE